MEIEGSVSMQSPERELLYLVLDLNISIEEKSSRISTLIEGGADIDCSLPDEFALGGSHALLLAVVVGQQEVVELLLEHSANVDQILVEPHFHDSVCPTALHQACLDGRLDLVQTLTGVPCSLELKNYRGQTPFHLAVESGNTDLVGWLVDSGSFVQSCDSNGNNALHMTTGLGDVVARDMVDLLVTHGISIYQRNRLGFTPVRLAAVTGRDVCSRLMLTRAHEHHDGRLHDIGLLPLEAAVADRNCGRIVSILRRSASVSAADESLHMVVMNPQLNSVLRLLLFSPDMRQLVNGNSSLGYTPLYNACARRNYLAAQMLLESGADPDKASQQRHVLPLKKTVLQNDLLMSRLLLDHGASACHCPTCSDALGRRGQTGPALVGVRDGGDSDLLHLALFTDIPMCRLLISGGTCLSSDAESIITANPVDYSDLLTGLYDSGRHQFLRRMLKVASESLSPDSSARDRKDLDDTYSIEDKLRLLLKSPASLRHTCRVVIRNVLQPKVFWATQHLILPDIIKSYLTLDW